MKIFQDIHDCENGTRPMEKLINGTYVCGLNLTPVYLTLCQYLTSEIIVEDSKCYSMRECYYFKCLKKVKT